MKGITLVQVNQQTLVAAMQLYLDTAVLGPDAHQTVLRVATSANEWVKAGDIIGSCIVEMQCGVDADPECDK
jgi:hypothetical protein